jgi:hypothetical protein
MQKGGRVFPRRAAAQRHDCNNLRENPPDVLASTVFAASPAGQIRAS